MPNSIERPPPPSPLIKSAEHSTDHERHGRERFRDAQDDEQNPKQQHREHREPAPEEPAYLLDTHHVEPPKLDGVSAYQAAAQHAKQALAMQPKGAKNLNSETDALVYSPAGAMPKAYEKHAEDDDEHKVNLAT